MRRTITRNVTSHSQVAVLSVADLYPFSGLCGLIGYLVFACLMG
jgi:hypothetical protein